MRRHAYRRAGVVVLIVSIADRRRGTQRPRRSSCVDIDRALLFVRMFNTRRRRAPGSSHHHYNHSACCNGVPRLVRTHTATPSRHISDMELGRFLWPSDPVTRESSDPETQLTRWPCSIMNSKCRLMLQTNVCNGQEVCQFLSLFGVCTFLESKILKIIY